jgi:serine/threonine protein kinase
VTSPVPRGDPQAELSADERARLAQGFHEEVAEGLLGRGRPDLAGWVREQIWDYEGAYEAYRGGGKSIDALRCALESGKAAHLDEILAFVEAHAEPATVDAAIALLEKRRRPMDAARLLALRDERPSVRADALIRAGDRLGAARVLADASRTHDALELLAPGGRVPSSITARALAARLAWDLGDAEGAARHAQAALRSGNDDLETRRLLARALGSLGHDLAAQMVLGEQSSERGERSTLEGVPGRYRVTGLRQSSLVGAAYVGIDRLTLQEVEIHLLLADVPEAGNAEPEVAQAIERFAAVAEAAAAIGHPAIRPILRLDTAAGLLVMPRAEGQNLRALIRPPGMTSSLSRARSLVAFMVEGLAAAHGRGLVHGSLLPSTLWCDALGRPTLGPFGAHHLAGLAVTHTGSLEELMVVSAPEVRAGGAPSVKSDLFAVGALFVALLFGTMQGARALAAARRDPGPEPAELRLARRLLDPDPDARPTIDVVLETLRKPVANVRELGVISTEPEAPEAARRETSFSQHGVELTVAQTWSDERLDALCSASNPWLQPILDRRGRQLVLAPWPEGSRALDETTTKRWRDLLPGEALELEDPELQGEIMRRLRPSSMVATPAGQWMVALDDLLSR